jgi:hypothetical protein
VSGGCKMSFPNLPILVPFDALETAVGELLHMR